METTISFCSEYSAVRGSDRDVEESAMLSTCILLKLDVLLKLAHFSNILLKLVVLRKLLPVC
jgi:hypothetical protein